MIVTSKEGYIGFGMNQKEAELDLLVYRSSLDINNDTTGVFKKRREELHPWMPKENILHIRGLGCLIIDGNYITNTKNGIKLPLLYSQESIFWYLVQLLGDSVKFSDLLVVLKPELELLFKTSPIDITPISKFARIQLANADSGFLADTVFFYDNGYVIGLSEDVVGVKRNGEQFFYTVAVKEPAMRLMVLPYIGYRMKIIIKEDGIYG